MANLAQQPERVSSNQRIGLPVLIETIFTLSKLTVILVGIIVMVLTFANGNPYWVVMIRGGVTVLSLGLLLWFITWFSTKGVIESVRNMLKEAGDNESPRTNNSMDNEA